MTDWEAIKARQKRVWGAGNYSVIATALYSTAEVLCEEVNVPAGARVLDVACGSGNVALAAARRRADVIGIDFVAPLLDHARERAAAEWLTFAKRMPRHYPSRTRALMWCSPRSA